HVDDRLQFVEEPVEIMEREIKRLKRSWIPLVKVRWNSRRGPEFTWEREDSFRKKCPHLFTNRVTSSTASLHPLKEHCPQSLRPCRGRRNPVCEEMWAFLSERIFTFPSELGTSPRVPANLNQRYPASLQSFDFPFHDFNGLFHKLEPIVNVNSFQWQD
nr:putative reverse transcriptase domain-containing protein [Tanacetum cinerariifolium]